MELDNALLGQENKKLGPAKSQLPEDWRDNMDGRLERDVLLPASDQGPDVWCFWNWADSDDGRIVNVREPDVHNHGLHNDVIGGALDCMHGTYLFCATLVMNVHFLQFRDGKYGRMFEQMAKELRDRFTCKEVLFQHHYAEIADEKGIAHDAYAGPEAEETTWRTFLASRCFWLYQQKVGMCRWGQIFQRLPGLCADWTSFLSLLLRLCVDEKFMDSSYYTEVLGGIAGAVSAGESKFDRTTKESSADELKELRKACKHALNFTIHFLMGWRNKMVTRVLGFLSQAVWHAYSVQAKTLVATMANGTWGLEQVKGKIWQPLVDTIGFLQTPSKLEEMGIDIKATIEPLCREETKGTYHKCVETSQTAGQFAMAIVRRRIGRLAFLMFGWPYHFALFLDPEADVRQAALDRLREDSEAYDHGLTLRTKYYQNLMKRSPMRLPVVRMILEPLRANGYNLTAPILEKVALLNRGFKQSRLVERGINKARKKEAASTNKELSEVGLMAHLIEGGLLSNEYKYNTYDLKTLPYERNGTMDAARFRGLKRKASIDLSSIKGTTRSAPWYSPGPAGWPRGFYELGFLRTMVANATCAEGEANHWQLPFFPRDKAFVVSTTLDPGMDDPWFLVLGPTDCCVWTWPLQRAFAIEEIVGWDIVVAPGTQAVPLYCDGLQVSMRTCTWASPAEQRHEYGVPAPQCLLIAACLRLATTDSGPMKFLPCCALHAFHTATWNMMFQLAGRLGLPVTKKTSLSDLLEILIRHYWPEVTDLELYRIIWKRRPKTDDTSGLLDIPEMVDMVDGADREHFEQIAEKQAHKKKQDEKFWASMRPLRAKCVAAFEALEVEKASGVRTSGLSGAATDADLTEANATCWLPPSSRIHRDSYNGRWRVHWPHGDVSRSWGEHGLRGSLRKVLQIAWQAYKAFSGMECGVPGVFAAAAAAPGAVEAAAPVAGARGGRGGGVRGGRGGRRGGLGRGAALAAAAVAPEAAEVAPAAAEEAESNEDPRPSDSSGGSSGGSSSDDS